MLHSLQETKYEFLLLLLLLLQLTQMKFKQQQRRQQQQQQQKQYISVMKVAPKREKLHFSDLQYIYISIYASHMYFSVNCNITISY